MVKIGFVRVKCLGHVEDQPSSELLIEKHCITKNCNIRHNTRNLPTPA